MNQWWTDYPWRLIQTNLREIDMEDIDAEVYVSSLKEMKATVAMINVAGIIASYETSLPFHFQSPHLNGDSLSTIIDACHEAGIKVIARTDFSKVRRPIYEEHPDWACRYGDGVIEDYNGNVHCCINGDYQQKYAPLIVREALQTLAVDGIFFNMGGYVPRNYSHEYLGICRCASCRDRFSRMYGLELPQSESEADPAHDAYAEFKRRTVEEYRRKIVSLIQEVRPDVAIDHNTVTGEGFYRQESNTEVGRALPHWQYSASENTKRVVTSWPKLVSSNASVDFIGFPYRHTAVSPHQQELRLRQNLANCGGLDYYLIGRLDNHRDRSGFEAVERVFAFHAQHWEATFRMLRPASRLLLVSGTGDTGEYRGWFRVLVESHLPFDVCTADRLAAVGLDGYETVVIPDAAELSPEVAGAVDTFVSSGGTLVATGRYGVRGGFSLECLGIAGRPFVRTDMRSAVLEIVDKGLFPSLAGRDLVALGDVFVFGEYDKDGESRATRLIPPHQFGPPERCYWTVETEVPGMVVRSHGTGRAIYLPWLPGAFFHREGYDNTAGFMADVLVEVAGARRIGGSLSPMVETTLAQPPDGCFLLLQLVNGSGHFGTSFYPPIEMVDVAVTLDCPREPRRVSLLTEDRDVEFRWNGSSLSLTLPRLGAYEAVKIVFA